MPFDGAGNFTRVHSWVDDDAANIKIQASRVDAEDDGFATAFNLTFLRDGRAPMSGDLPLGNNFITGIGAGSESTPAISFHGDPSTGIFQTAPGELSFSVVGVAGGKINANGLLVDRLGINTIAPRTAVDIADLTSLMSVLEQTVYDTVALTGTVQFSVLLGALVIHDANAVANWTFNVRGDGTNSLDSLMAVGQTITVVTEVPQGVTGYYCTAITVDGAAPAQIKWFGTGAPTQGNVSSIEVYTISIYKKAAATFYVRGSRTNAK